MQKWLTYFPWLLVVFLCLYKIPDLSLPYFWDEAWSYFPALKAMRDAGPSLLPGAIDPALYRGHPLLFYFLSSGFMSVFPGSIAWSKTFPLLISCLLLLKTFQFTKTHFNTYTAILASSLLLIQSVFVAQASFLLPEMLLSLFTLLALDAFLKKQKWQTVLWVSLALYTKESALVLALALICWQWFNSFAQNEYRFKLQPFLNTFYLFLPFAFISVFFILQKRWIGWVFFPEHIGYISLSSFLDKANMYAGYLFIFRGRNLLSFSAIACFILLFFKQKDLLKQYQNILCGLTFFVVSYMAFSALNFYSPRYLLSVLPPVVMIFSFLLVQTFLSYKKVMSLLILIVIGNNVYYTFFRFEPNDHTLGYRNMIKVHQKMGAYLEKEIPKNASIATHFLMKANLEIPEIGYLSFKEKYNQVHLIAGPQTQWILISNIEIDEDLNSIAYSKQAKLQQKFEQGSCWVALYRVEPTNP